MGMLTCCCLLVFGCAAASSQAQDGPNPKADPVVGKLPPQYLVRERAFKLDVPAKGTTGEEANRFMIDLLMRSRAKLNNLTGHHADYLTYTGRLTKKEYIPQSKKTLRQVGDFKFRYNVFSVRFDWIEGVNEGKTTVFIKRKKYDGKMYVAVPWVLWWVKIDPHDKRVFKNSRRAITGAGLHNMALALLDEAWKVHRWGMYDVDHKGTHYTVTYLGVVKDPIEGRPKYKFKRTLPAEVWTPRNDNGQPMKDKAGRPVQVRFISPDVTCYIDVQWKVPTRVEVFDWDGNLAEEYSFTNLKWGVKYTRPDDKDFWDE